MDPMFGLPAVRESRAVEDARFRNRSQERRLSAQMSLLETQHALQTLKILDSRNQAKELLKSLLPSDPGKNHVCPFGFTQEEKAEYQRLKKGLSSLSISLEEFDKLRQGKRTEDAEISEKSSVVAPEKISNKTKKSSLSKCKLIMRDALHRYETNDIHYIDLNQCDKQQTKQMGRETKKTS